MRGLTDWRLFILVLVSLKTGTLSAQNQLLDPFRPLLNPEPYRELAGDDAETKLLKERVRHAQAMAKYQLDRYRIGAGSRHFLQKNLEGLRESQIEFHTDTREKVDVLTHHLGFATELEKMVKERVIAGRTESPELSAAGYYRATLELRLLQAKKALPKENP